MNIVNHYSSSLKVIAILLSISVVSMSFKISDRGEVTLEAGTPLILETATLIRSEMVRAGQFIDFVLKQDVISEGKILIESGSIAKGQVIRSSRAKGFGKEGFVEIQIKTIKAVDGQDVYLSGGYLYQQGENRHTTAIVLTVTLFCVLFLALKGTNAEVPPGYLIENCTVATAMKINVQ